MAERRNPSTGATQEDAVDDILNMFDVLDLQSVFVNCKSAASNLDSVSKYGPDEVNLSSVVDRQLYRSYRQGHWPLLFVMSASRSNITGGPDIEATSLQVAENIFSSSVCVDRQTTLIVIRI